MKINPNNHFLFDKFSFLIYLLIIYDNTYIILQFWCLYIVPFLQRFFVYSIIRVHQVLRDFHQQMIDIYFFRFHSIYLNC
jgi:hypothetical protein